MSTWPVSFYVLAVFGVWLSRASSDHHVPDFLQHQHRYHYHNHDGMHWHHNGMHPPIQKMFPSGDKDSRDHEVEEYGPHNEHGNDSEVNNSKNATEVSYMKFGCSWFDRSVPGPFKVQSRVCGFLTKLICKLSYITFMVLIVGDTIGISKT